MLPTIRLIHTLVFATFVIAPLFLQRPVAAANTNMVSRPNIIFFLVDDLGWQDTSVSFWKEKTAFQDHFRTPNVKRLAEQGIRFTSAYSCAVCSPTRTSIMTGQNAARHGVTNWTLYADRDQSGRTNRLLPPKNWNKRGLQPHQLTLPRLLQSAGYRTIHCGKAHWGAYGTPGSDPTRLGFDINIAGHPAGAPGSYQGRDNYGNNPDGTHKRPWGVPGLKKYHGTDAHLTDALAIEACAAIDAAVNNSQPFFLYMAPYAVHTPIQEHPRFITNYRGKKYLGTGINIPEPEAKYASMVQGYDDALGHLLAKLEKIHVAENTIVVFTSDNGGLSVHARGMTPRETGANTHNWPLREGKGSAYEGGTRVPMIVSWAKRNEANEFQRDVPITANSQCDTPIICEDYLPTLCRWARIKIKDALAQLREERIEGTELHQETVIDGVDITPLVTGEGTIEARPLYFHYPHVWGPRGDGYQPHTALRWGNIKLIYFQHSRRWEMYDLDDDIGEQHDIKAEQTQNFAVASEYMLRNFRQYDIRDADGVPGNCYVERPTNFHTAIEPVPSSEDRAAAAGWTGGGTWLDQHKDINAISKQGDIELVFLGDSITQSWGGPGRNVGASALNVWEKFYGDRKAANFGISGDRTQNVLWRIHNGNFDGIHPRVIVVLIGTNNLADNTPPEIAHGIEQIVMQLEERRDRSKILLLGILPRGKTPDDPIRAKIREVNHRIEVVADDQKTFFLDIGKRFLEPDGQSKDSHFQSDYLHLSAAGYREWAEAIEAYLRQLFDERKPHPFPITELDKTLPAALKSRFTHQCKVFGVRILANDAVRERKIMHAANILAQYLDNDANGEPDNLDVAEMLAEQKATLVMFRTAEMAENFFEGITDKEIDEIVDDYALQDLYDEETHPVGAATGRFDASLEEVLHLITGAGFSRVYPDVFGEQRGSKIADAMDVARGGHFDRVPRDYPDQAWYSYDDRTCDYACQITEYFYWGLTSLLDGQNFPGRIDQIKHEWRANTPEKMKTMDTRLFELLSNEEYSLPTRLPDGFYVPAQKSE